MTQNDDVARGAQVQRGLRRVERRLAPMVGAVVLADVSGSMDFRDGGDSGPRRIDRLARVLDYVLKRVRVQSLVCFSDSPVAVSLEGRVVLPEPGGGTALDLALEYVFEMVPRPSRVFVLSDGMPNWDEGAFIWAKRLAPMIIDAYYVGPDNYGPALAFMRSLAACGGPGGRSGHFDMVDPVLLGSELHRRLLGRAS